LDSIWTILLLGLVVYLLFFGWKRMRAGQLSAKWQRDPMSLSDAEMGEILKSIASWERTYLDANVEVQSRLINEYSQKQVIRNQIESILAHRNSK